MDAVRGHEGSAQVQLSRRDANAMTVVIIATMFCNGFMITLMSVTLPDVSRTFHVPVSMANWIILAFTIIGATMIAMGARLLHRWGIKVIFCLATALMALGGVIGFLAVDYAMLMVARILQAAAAGLLFPSASTALLTIAAPGKRALWLSLFTAFGGIGFAISPFISGLLLTSFGVHAVFAPTAVAGVLCCIASALAMKPIGERDPRSARIDVLSVLIIFAGLGASMFGISLLEHDALLACGLIGGGCIMLCLFAWRQSCLAVPLLDLRPLKSRMFVVGILLLMFGSLAEHAVRLTLPLYLEGAIGFDASAAGLAMFIPQLTYSATSMVAGRLTDARGIWPVVPLGFLVIAAGFAGMLFLSSQGLALPIIVAAVLILGGVGLVSSPNRATALEALDPKLLAAGASIASVAIQLASSLSSSLLVGSFSSQMEALMHDGMAKAAAYGAGFQHTLIIMCAIEAVMLIVSAIYAWRRRASGLRVASRAASAHPASAAPGGAPAHPSSR